jgi:DNA mismatch endonuclease (patch repair protein)
VERLLRKKLPQGRFVGVSKQHSKRMRAVKGRGNKTTESRLRSILMQAGVCGWRIVPKEIQGRPDFYFKNARLAVFVDGCFWHGCSRCGHVPQSNSNFWRAKIKRNRVRDNTITDGLRSSGIAVLRFWEHELRTNLPRCLGQIKVVIQRRLSR